MAGSLLCYELGDLCLGKPPLRSLSASSSTIADALTALKSSDDNFISVWSCCHHSHHDASDSDSDSDSEDCVCVGKLCMVDIICYLCREDNLSSPPSLALKAPLSALLSTPPAGLVKHVDPSTSLLEAIDIILQGAQNLVVPIKSSSSSSSSSTRRKQLTKSSTLISPTAHNGREFCWLTQEDLIRFLLGSIGLFSPIPTLSIDNLGIIRSDILAIGYHSPASSAVGAIASSLADQTSVAVVDDDGVLIGEISPYTLSCCDETVAAAITTLSAGDLMAYIDCGGPPEETVSVVKARLKERNLEGMLEEFTMGSSSNLPSLGNSSSSSDEELPSPTVPLTRRGRHSRSSSYSARMVKTSEAIVCHPGSSIVAVMIQAIAHRVNYVWVIEEDYGVVGIVTFANMLVVFRDHLEAMA